MEAFGINETALAGSVNQKIQEQLNIMANKMATIQTADETTTYSPDFNKIEHDLVKLKSAFVEKTSVPTWAIVLIIILIILVVGGIFFCLYRHLKKHRTVG